MLARGMARPQGAVARTQRLASLGAWRLVTVRAAGGWACEGQAGSKGAGQISRDPPRLRLTQGCTECVAVSPAFLRPW